MGLFLGWQAVVALAVAALAVCAVNWHCCRRVVRQMWQIPATVWLLTLTLLGSCFGCDIVNVVLILGDLAHER